MLLDVIDLIQGFPEYSGEINPHTFTAGTATIGYSRCRLSRRERSTALQLGEHCVYFRYIHLIPVSCVALESMHDTRLSHESVP
jgi:hypothetical protein